MILEPHLDFQSKRTSLCQDRMGQSLLLVPTSYSSSEVLQFSAPEYQAISISQMPHHQMVHLHLLEILILQLVLNQVRATLFVFKTQSSFRLPHS